MTSTDNTQHDFSPNYPEELRDQLLAIRQITDEKVLSDINESMNSTLDQVCNKIEEKVENIRARTSKYPHSHPVIDLLLDKFKRFNYKRNGQEKMDVKLIPYQLDLADRLERIDWDNHEINGFPPVDEALIYMNYNSKSYIKMLEGWLAKRIEEENDPMGRVLKNEFYQKAFSQLHRSADAVLHPKYPSLTEVIGNWFVHEKTYLDNQLELYIKAKDTKLENAFVSNSTKKESRVRLQLSADQIALLLRAADDTQVLLSKSMNAIFQSIVPYLSSKNRDILSASAVRTSSYRAEQSDKDTLISALRNIIQRIEGY